MAIAYNRLDEFRMRNLLAVDIEGEMSKDIGYGYAMSAYKARGMKFDNVYINERGFNNLSKTVLRSELLYTSVATANENVIFHTKKKVEEGNSYVDKKVPLHPKEVTLTPEATEEQEKHIDTKAQVEGDNAPDDVIDKEKSKLKEFEERQSRISGYLAELGKQ